MAIIKRCPKCGKSTGGEIDPLDDVAEWNKINKITKGEKNVGINNCICASNLRCVRRKGTICHN